MKRTSQVFKSFLPQLWYLLGVTVFYFLFSIAYSPYWIFEYLNTLNSSFYFNVTMIFCILFLTMSITRLLVYHFIQEIICRNYIIYALWCLIEIFIAAWFVALYLSLMFNEFYFTSLGKSMGILYMTCCYPIVIITLSYAIIEFTEKPLDESLMVRFRDYSKKLKFTVDSRTILYIAAEENYLRIYYVEGMTVKNYQLRASMNSIQKTAADAGLFRCQRSYFINPSHITALKKDKFGNITADLDYGNTSVRVSKKLYDDLSELI